MLEKVKLMVLLLFMVCWMEGKSKIFLNDFETQKSSIKAVPATPSLNSSKVILPSES